MRGVFGCVSALLLASCHLAPGVAPLPEPAQRILPREGYVQVEPDLRLYYRILGSGPDTVLIPYHGIPAFERLARGRTVIIYDRRGLGASDAVDSLRLASEFDLRDIEAVRRELGLGRVSLVGQSYMAALVLRYAADHPEHVDRVVAFAPPPIRLATWRTLARPKPRVDSAVIWRLAELRAAGVDTLDPAAFCREERRLDIVRLQGDTAALSESTYEPCAHPNEWPANKAVWMRRIPRSFGNFDWRAEARRVQAPVLILFGTEDPATAIEGANEWLEHLPDARLLPIVGAEHSVWDEAPEL